MCFVFIVLTSEFMYVMYSMRCVIKFNFRTLHFLYSVCHQQKFREYVLGSSRIARLDAKHEHIRHTLLEAAGDSPTSLKGLQQRHAGQTTKPPRRKRIGRLQMNGQPKLFGGSLEEYLETTNHEIPLIMKSCIRVINLYGMLQCGFFTFECLLQGTAVGAV
jgi:hypothetical protein